jgi:hypothetical protein
MLGGERPDIQYFRAVAVGRWHSVRRRRDEM